ncbi:hypothetical protein [Microbacterium sp. NPDC055521]
MIVRPLQHPEPMQSRSFSAGGNATVLDGVTKSTRHVRQGIDALSQPHDLTRADSAGELPLAHAEEHEV